MHRPERAGPSPVAIEPTQLLLKLAGLAAGRPVHVGGAIEARPPEGVDFAALLRKAAAGEGESGRDVVIGAGVDVELDASQAARLSAAADVAESQGFDRALVLIDGKALVLDVGERTVLASVDPGRAGAAGDIDGVVSAAPAEAEVAGGTSVEGAGQTAAVPARTSTADALLRMLDRVWERPGTGGV